MNYADPDQQAIAEAREDAQQDAREQLADADYNGGRIECLDERTTLLNARLRRTMREADELREQLMSAALSASRTNDDAELWMRAVESALATARQALPYLRKYTVTQ